MSDCFRSLRERVIKLYPTNFCFMYLLFFFLLFCDSDICFALNYIQISIIKRVREIYDRLIPVANKTYV